MALSPRQQAFANYNRAFATHNDANHPEVVRARAIFDQSENRRPSTPSTRYRMEAARADALSRHATTLSTRATQSNNIMDLARAREAHADAATAHRQALEQAPAPTAQARRAGASMSGAALNHRDTAKRHDNVAEMLGTRATNIAREARTRRAAPPAAAGTGGSPGK